ncbi:MAG: hypothetical protein RJB02_1301 [Pseudomonadota bacterium]
MSQSFDRIGPQPAKYPVILSIPHAGRAYAAPLLADCRFPAERLIPLEDRYADLLAEDAWRAGFSGLIARTPRAVIDLNRAEHDLDPGMLTAPMGPPALLSIKARGGLGLIPRRTPALGDLWRRKFDPAEVSARIAAHHRPYHDALNALLMTARRRFAAVLLLDVHSMPPLGGTATDPAPQIVIGDRFGRSCRTLFSEMAGNVAMAAGYRVAFNAPYAGGHILERHAKPDHGIHALQVEVDRRLYLDADLTQHGPGLPRVTRMIADMAATLATHLADQNPALAAE